MYHPESYYFLADLTRIFWCINILLINLGVTNLFTGEGQDKVKVAITAPRLPGYRTGQHTRDPGIVGSKQRKIIFFMHFVSYIIPHNCMACYNLQYIGFIESLRNSFDSSFDRIFVYCLYI